MSKEEKNTKNVIKFVEALIYDSEDVGKITPAVIEEKIAIVIKMNPRWGEGLEHSAVIDELIRRFSVWVGQDTTLKNEEGHKQWLNSDRKKDWRYWQRYQDWLEYKLSLAAIDALDQSTDSILGLLEDPLSQGSWDRRGLVVGHVQSGKTGSYTGLICKAADAGYKIVIVLAGMHNNLRSQTQIRLDEGFLGFATNSDPENIEYIGVGVGGREAGIKPNCATNRSERGDFNRKIAKHLAITPEQRPWLFVVKKNKTVLNSLLTWVKNHVADTTDSEGRKVVNNLPLLVIDDEADHASVDTGEQVLDTDGVPNVDHQPTAINSLIRKILHSFNRVAYVGYTATPFANIFIHERGETKEEGKDLFPSSFIINLAAPSSYVGPSKVFGLQTSKGRLGGLPLVRIIDDHQSSNQAFGWMPQKHKNGHMPLYEGMPTLPNSLIEAIDAFLLVCAIRILRGQQNEHSSMLVHVTRFNTVQKEVFNQINAHVRHLRQRITRAVDNDVIICRLKKLWDKDFLPTTEIVSQAYPDEVPCQSFNWDDVLTVLGDTISDIDVRMINGTAKDALDYAENQEKGLKVIAIGGDKLARGLTLEGLCVSYFLRASKMYDTLMQMGRWFGYRPNYIDLSRLYTTFELVEWFGHIADASEELREEFNLMAASGSSPREYGLKVQSHPVLMVTSRLKMRTARNLMISFSGQIVETTSLYKDRINVENNLNATKVLIDALGCPHEINPTKSRGDRKDKWTGYVWSKVPVLDIINFLLDYRTHPAAYKVNSSVLAEFIRAMSNNGELTSWTVALLGITSGESYSFASDIKINMVKRADKLVDDRYSIGRLLDPKDEAIDLDEKEWSAALALTRAAKRPDPGRMQDNKEPDIPSGPAIRKLRGFGSDDIQPHPERGLLLLYVLDPNKSEIVTNEVLPPIVAFGISFPGSHSGLKIEYMVNNVLWEQEYGPAE